MLFQVDKRVNMKFIYNFMKNDNSFFVFNVRNFQENFYIYNYFKGDILHIKQLNNFSQKDMFLGLFSGNIFFCFINSIDFLKV